MGDRISTEKVFDMILRVAGTGIVVGIETETETETEIEIEIRIGEGIMIIIGRGTVIEAVIG